MYHSGSRGLPPRWRDPLGQLNHLEDRLLAVQPHDVVIGQPPQIGVGLAAAAGQHLDEHRHHHFRPTLADQRQGAVEIEQDIADFRPGAEPRAELDKADERPIILAGRRGHREQLLKSEFGRAVLSRSPIRIATAGSKTIWDSYSGLFSFRGSFK